MKSILFLLAFTLLLSCKTGKVTIRLQNISDYDFKKITVRIGDTLKVFENISKGSKTVAFETNRTYRYCFTSIILSNNDTVNCRPRDFVGEKLHKRGKFKMQFDMLRIPQQRNYYILIKLKRQL